LPLLHKNYAILPQAALALKSDLNVG